MTVTRNTYVEGLILARLRHSDATFSQLCADLPTIAMRQVDSALRRLRIAGTIVSLARVSGFRPQPEWHLVSR